jgi:CspA family cold shock protein
MSKHFNARERREGSFDGPQTATIGRSGSAPRHQPASGPKETGSLKWFNASKGYGFITPDAGGKDVFVHAKALERSGLSDNIPDGQRLSNRTETRQKGISAVDVDLI